MAAGSADQGAGVAVAASDWPEDGVGGLWAIDAVDRDAIGVLDIPDSLLGQRPVVAVDRETGAEIAPGDQGYLQPGYGHAVVAKAKLAVPVPAANANGWDPHLVAGADTLNEAGAGTANRRAGRGDRRQRDPGDPRSGDQHRSRS